MRVVLAITLLAVVAPAARAQLAVFDIKAFVQLLTQVRTLQQQLSTAQSHLTQAQSEFQSITGGVAWSSCSPEPRVTTCLQSGVIWSAQCRALAPAMASGL